MWLIINRLVKIFTKKTPKIQLNASSYRLFDSKELDVKPRSNSFIPKPFLLNDAIIRKGKLISKNNFLHIV